EGNLIPHLGTCPEGFFIWPTPENGLDHDICSDTPEDASDPAEAPVDETITETEFIPNEEEVGSTDDGGDKDVVPVLGFKYVVGTDGDGLVCRDAPNGDYVDLIPEGDQVGLISPVDSNGWQEVVYEASSTSFPSCFVS